MAQHASSLLVTSPPRQAVRVALVGNPNTGKTTLFNALAGLRQRVGNYPGVTVEAKKGHMTHHGRPFDLIDLPGTYSLAPRSPDEMVAVDVILGSQEREPRPDVILAIVDGSNLERNLYLTTQLLEVGVPVVVALNMVDLATVQGLRIDAERLSRQLGIPVVAIQANKRKGLDQLKAALAEAAGRALPKHRPRFPEPFEREVDQLRDAVGDGVPDFLWRRLLVDVGGSVEERLSERFGPELRDQVRSARQRLAAAGCAVPAVEARTRYAWIREVTAGCVERPRVRPVTWTDRLDRVLTHKIGGTLIFLLLMFVVFQSIFTWARQPMSWIGAGKDWLADGVRALVTAGPLASLLADGIVEGVGSVVIFLPQILILFGFIAVLEDCGYMARAAFLMDKLMARCGLSGKSFIPLLSSFACAIPGIMAARVIENRRDRLATVLVAPLMSCSARLPVYILLIAVFIPTDTWLGGWLPGLTMFGMYLIGLVVAPLVALALKRTLLRGETPIFLMEMPLYKMPSLRTVLRRIADSGWAFMRRAGTLILASMIVVWALLYFPDHDAAGHRYAELIAAEEERLEKTGMAQQETEQAIVEARKKLREFQQELEQAAADHRVALQAKIADAQREVAELEERVRSIYELHRDWKGGSILGQLGQTIEPAVEPLGWDWKIGTAALASFPAREVVVGTLGIIYNQGKVSADDIRDADDAADTRLGRALRSATWDNDPQRKVFTVPVALSLMVFFALCCQCASTLAVIKRETNSWRWPAFTFVYMTVLAYVGALVVYQVGRMLS